MFLLALIPFRLTASFTAAQLSCLIGIMFANAFYSSMYLYSAELAPTSHRGKMMGYCSVSARIGKSNFFSGLKI